MMKYQFFKYLTQNFQEEGFYVAPEKINSQTSVMIFFRGGYKDFSKITEKYLTKFLGKIAQKNNCIIIGSQLLAYDRYGDNIETQAIEDVLNYIDNTYF